MKTSEDSYSNYGISWGELAESEQFLNTLGKQLLYLWLEGEFYTYEYQALLESYFILGNTFNALTEEIYDFFYCPPEDIKSAQSEWDEFVKEAEYFDGFWEDPLPNS